jgi:protein involved in ribonucleotide reduction
MDYVCVQVYIHNESEPLLTFLNGPDHSHVDSHVNSHVETGGNKNFGHAYSLNGAMAAQVRVRVLRRFGSN